MVYTFSPSPGRQRKAELCEASLGDSESRIAEVTQRNACHEKKKSSFELSLNVYCLLVDWILL